jgi:hypothetical protein
MEREQFLETNSSFVVLDFHHGKQREMAPKNTYDERTWREWVWKGLFRTNHLKKDVTRTLLFLSKILQRPYLLLVLSLLLLLVS